MTEPGAERLYTIAVRALCEFTAKQGDLDLRFTPSPTAQQGMAGHAMVASRRGPTYQAELTLSGRYRQLRVRGRADGYDPDSQRLEEVKTYRGRLEAMPANHRHLHWAQAKVYGWLLCQQRGLAQLEVALVYYDIGSQQETVFTERCTAASLQAFFEDQCQRFLGWAQQELAHRAARDDALAALSFPHGAFRTGQRPLAEAVYKAATSGRCLLAQAPTGIGKTVGTLFPLLKAAPAQGLDKVFFLTAKTSGRQLALDALVQISGAPGPQAGGNSLPAAPLRVLEMVARDKACEHPTLACHGDACPLARGFYDRLPAARQAALAAPTQHKAAVREAALAHQVCPYYLGQELARWCDVVVGDYNHYFDLHALLHGLAQSQQWKVGVLVDEAHNLVERARAMYSTELDQSRLSALQHVAPRVLAKPLARLQHQWSALNRTRPETQGPPHTAPLALSATHPPYHVHAAVPGLWLTALQAAITAMGEHLAEAPAAPAGPLQAFYFDALRFARLAESFDDHSLLDRQPAPSDPDASVLCLRNIVPAPFLKPRLASAHTTTLFSATLQPQAFYRDTLGLPDTTAWVDVEAPFRSEQLQVHIARHISTRYQDREASLPAIGALMATQFAQRPGNYLAFVSSFDYLRRLQAWLDLHHPLLPTWAQSRAMAEREQTGFLARFQAGGQGIGLAVLGGAFAEGIDLPGERLIGAFIATLGLPQLNPVNEQVRQRLEALFGAGHDYAYLYPGLQKVVQAAGRVIRTPADTGVVHLMDDRFARPQVRRLLPAWWQPQG